MLSPLLFTRNKEGLMDINNLLEFNPRVIEVTSTQPIATVKNFWSMGPYTLGLDLVKTSNQISGEIYKLSLRRFRRDGKVETVGHSTLLSENDLDQIVDAYTEFKRCKNSTNAF